MKKIVCIFMVFLFILIGCSGKSASKEPVHYNKEKVVESLKKLSFNPEIPKLLPYEPTETRVNVMENRLIEVSFLNKKQEEITFRAGKSENAIDFTNEKIKIQDNLSGRYGEKDNFKILRWKKDNIYYELLGQSNSISKEKMLKIAKSFYPIN